MQLAVANLTSVLYFAIQLQAMPYKSLADNYLALGCSLALTVMLLCSIFYKYASLVELPGIAKRLSFEQRNDFTLTGIVLTGIFMVCVVGTLIFSFMLLLVQLRDQRRREALDARNRKARRLKFKGTNLDVMLSAPKLPPKKHTDFKADPKALTANADDKREFHIFLSHVWGTGQDQMRIVCTRSD